MFNKVFNTFGSFVLVLCLLPAPAAGAEAYPEKPITVVLPYTPGGAMDRLLRLIADQLSQQFSQAVVVENVGGAGGNIGAARVFNAQPNGYTLLFGSTAQLVTNKFLYSKLTFDPDRLAPIVHVATNSFVLVANPRIQATNIAQLIAIAKENPGSITYLSAGVGTPSHLATEMFSRAADMKLLHIPYKSSSAGMTDILAGNVDLGFFTPDLIETHVKSGRLRVLAVGSKRPNPIFPNTATLSSILPDIVAETWYAFAAPPGTPLLIRQKFAATVSRILTLPDVAKAMAEMNIKPVGGTPGEMSAFIEQEKTRWEKTVRESRITLD